MQAQDLGLIICASCSELKYQRFHKRGIMYLQRQAIPSELDMLETYEWFGSGHQPRREVIVSNRVAILTYESNWNPIWFKEVDLV